VGLLVTPYCRGLSAEVSAINTDTKSCDAKSKFLVSGIATIRRDLSESKGGDISSKIARDGFMIGCTDTLAGSEGCLLACSACRFDVSENGGSITMRRAQAVRALRVTAKNNS
jgi:hypothetical protein